MTGVVTAVDAATGKQLWQKPGTVPVPMYTSHAFSPIAARVGDRPVAIFHLGGQDQGALSAIDIENGSVKWSWTGDGPGYGSPIIVDLGGTRQVVTITQKKVVGVELATGTLLWERPHVNPSTANSNTPLVSGQTVIVSGNGGPTVAFTVAKSGNTWTTTNVWENADSPLRNTNMVLAGDMLFGLSNRNMGQYFALDVATGKTLWLSPGRQATNGAIMRIGDTLISLEDDGELVIVKKNPAAFEVVKKYKVAEQATWAEPVFAGNRIFVRDVDTLTLWTLN
jgi:outer membrane protein assembly factor BamB